MFHLKFLLGMSIAFKRAVDELLGLSNGAEVTYGPFLGSLILHLPRHMIPSIHIYIKDRSYVTLNIVYNTLLLVNNA